MFRRGLHTLAILYILFVLFAAMAHAQPSPADMDTDFFWIDPELFPDATHWMDESMMMPLEAVSEVAMANMVCTMLRYIAPTSLTVSRQHPAMLLSNLAACYSHAVHQRTIQLRQQ